MAGTSTAQDMAQFDWAHGALKTQGRPGQGLGGLNYAGIHWPVGVKTPVPDATDKASLVAIAHGRQMRREIDFAFAEARALAGEGFRVAVAANKTGDAEAKLLMKKWFGNEPTANTARNWWKGAMWVMGHLQAKLQQNINIYYRGDDSLIGKADDYPGAAGLLKARDVGGYAESGAGDKDGVIGLCKLFFAGSSGGRMKINRVGFDTIGGVLVHELSHNYCRTDDHEYNGKDCYGTVDCEGLARDRRRRAWYNADNIEYFCEEVRYAGKAKVDVAVAKVSLANITSAFAQLNAAAAPSSGVITGADVQGRINAIRQMKAVALNPSLSVEPAKTGNVAAKAALFGS